MTDEKFDVWQYLPRDWHEKVGEGLSAEEAVKLAHSYTTRPAAQVLPIIEKVQIVAQADDATVFLWETTEPDPETGLRGRIVYPVRQ
jgi:hypothetical protein